MATEHALDGTRIDHDWDRSRTAFVVRPGDVVHLGLPITGEGEVRESSSIDDVKWDFETIYNLAGPRSSSPTRGPWGWTAVIPELGLLAADFRSRS
jgi:hypothetical protein